LLFADHFHEYRFEVHLLSTLLFTDIGCGHKGIDLQCLIHRYRCFSGIKKLDNLNDQGSISFESSEIHDGILHKSCSSKTAFPGSNAAKSAHSAVIPDSCDHVTIPGMAEVSDFPAPGTHHGVQHFH